MMEKEMLKLRTLVMKFDDVLRSRAIKTQDGCKNLQLMFDLWKEILRKAEGSFFHTDRK